MKDIQQRIQRTENRLKLYQRMLDEKHVLIQILSDVALGDITKLTVSMLEFEEALRLQRSDLKVLSTKVSEIHLELGILKEEYAQQAIRMEVA